MKEEVIEKYVKDYAALLREIREYGSDLFHSEGMVIFSFGIIYKHLNLHGIDIRDERKGELDAIAFLDPKAKKQVTIEFELHSKDFVTHKHEPTKCDLLVCWKHNWKECPSNIDVFELDHFWKDALKEM